MPTPKFPKPTHGPPGSGLIPYQTIHDVISRIPKEASWHLNVHQNYKPPQQFKVPKKPYDAARAYARCITTSGGDNNYHPSGLRGFTPRELARIQGFPMDYQFHDSCMSKVRKQVGNALPPLAWSRVMGSCHDTLSRYFAKQEEEESMDRERVDSPFPVAAEPLNNTKAAFGSPRYEREESRTLSPDPRPKAKKRKIFINLTDD